jgi:hypothetical protein
MPMNDPRRAAISRLISPLSRTPPLAVRALAAAALVVEIVIHVKLAPEHLDEIRYIGVSFVVASIAMTVALAGLAVRPREPLSWLAGVLLCVGMCGLFVISRTVGLPDYHEGWTSDGGVGLACLPPEVVFVACAVIAFTDPMRIPHRASRG